VNDDLSKEEYRKKQKFMKKLFCFIVFIIVSFNLYSQEMQPIEYKPVKTDYLAKSKKQRTVGWILTGTGFVLTGTGLAIAFAHFAEGFGAAMAMSAAEPQTHSKIDEVLFLTGTAMFFTGITFLSIAKWNRRKAISMSFINESSQQLRYNTVMNTSVPSIRLRIQF